MYVVDVSPFVWAAFAFCAMMLEMSYAAVFASLSFSMPSLPPVLPPPSPLPPPLFIVNEHEGNTCQLGVEVNEDPMCRSMIMHMSMSDVLYMYMYIYVHVHVHAAHAHLHLHAITNEYQPLMN